MKRILTFLFATMLFVSGCSSGTAEHALKSIDVQDKKNPPSSFIPKDVEIVSVGDSLTQGVGDSTNQGGYIPYLKKDLETLKEVRSANFRNYGVKGNRTDQLEKRLDQKEIKKAIKKADLVIITIGGNDVMQVFKDNFSSLQVSKFEQALVGYKKRLGEIIETIRKNNPETGIVLVGIYNPFMKWFSDIKEVDEIIKEWNQASEQILTKYSKTKFIPIFDIFENQEENLLYTDYFHPNDHGYKLMAKRIFSYLDNNKLAQFIE